MIELLRLRMRVDGSSKRSPVSSLALRASLDELLQAEGEAVIGDEFSVRKRPPRRAKMPQQVWLSSELRRHLATLRWP